MSIQSYDTVLHPFEAPTGPDKLTRPGFMALMGAIILVLALLFGRAGILGAGAVAGIVVAVGYGIFIFKRPIMGLYTAVALDFVLIGLARYAPSVQTGLGMDAILYVTYIALFFNQFHQRINWTPAKKEITVLSAIWFAYSLFELLNPEAHNFEAWFSGRAIAMYMFLVTPLTLLLIDTRKKLDTILIIWGVFSILATLKGFMQLHMGVDRWEKAWLDAGNYKTHILFGRLRAFSFLSDAGQFGANQAYTGVVFMIASAATRGWKKVFFVVVAVLGLYGMIMSGTRGAISIPLTGFSAYFVYRKNIWVLGSGFLLLFVVFYFFKFTSIGQSNPSIRRMRTAFDPNNASLQVRLDNQRKLRSYLASRPFGGGIGLGGVKAQRFKPNAYLSQVPTDSWYVLIWVEQGIVGLSLHLFILFYILIKSSYKIMFRIRNPQVQLQMAALASGMFGVMVASYGNAVLGQMPTDILIYISMAVLLHPEPFDDPKPEIILRTNKKGPQGARSPL